MNRKISLGLAISIAAVACIITISLTYTFAINTFDDRMSGIVERQSMYNKLSELEQRVRSSYYGDIDDEELANSVAAGYVNGLEDEHSAFLSVEEYETRLEENEGYAFGLGIDISRNSDGNILINRVNSGSPASEAGVKKGDVITSVGGKSVSALGYDAAVALIDKTSPKVTFVVKRSSKEHKFTVTKSSYTVVSVEYHMVNDDVGLIRITEFNSKTPAQFAQALSELKDSGIRGLMIDLRDNKGGSYEYACDILDTILPAGKLMVVETEEGEEVKRVSDASNYKIPMAVLINENTQGAGELFAGAMADFGRAQLVGNATYGRTSVQELFELSDGTAVELTIAKWRTATNSAVSDGKITPQFEVVMTDYQQENRFILSDGEDPQIQTALECVQNQMSTPLEDTVLPEDTVSGSDAVSQSDTATTTTTASTSDDATTTAATTTAAS